MQTIVCNGLEVSDIHTRVIYIMCGRKPSRTEALSHSKTCQGGVQVSEGDDAFHLLPAIPARAKSNQDRGHYSPRLGSPPPVSRRATHFLHECWGSCELPSNPTQILGLYYVYFPRAPIRLAGHTYLYKLRKTTRVWV
jgi:hypothetical protein